MYELARPAIYSYSIQRGTPHVNLRQKRASLFNSQILVVALIGIFGGLKPKMCVHFSKDWRSGFIRWNRRFLPSPLWGDPLRCGPRRFHFFTHKIILGTVARRPLRRWVQ